MPKLELFPAKDYIGGKGVLPLDLQETVKNQNKFWDLKNENGKIDKDWCLKLHKGNVFKYCKKFLPLFGFYKYRTSDRADSDALIIQKKERIVRLVGSPKDKDVNDALKDWTIDCIQYLSTRNSMLRIPKNLEDEVFKCPALWDTLVTSFLPPLPQVEVNRMDKDGNIITDKKDQVPIQDSVDQGKLVFKNKIFIIRKGVEPQVVDHDTFPSNYFIWETDIIPHEITDDFDISKPKGMWYEFLQNISKECDGEWKINENNLRTIISAYGYLLHDYNTISHRKAIIFHDNTINEKDGGNGKGILSKSFSRTGIKRDWSVDMKQDANSDRFLLDGYTPDMRIVRFEDIQKGLNFERFYCWITDDFTVEGKNRSKFVIPEDDAPKIILTTNYPIPNSSRSDKRRQFFVPIGTFYGTLLERNNITVSDYHGTNLATRKDCTWTEEEWTDFYATCAYCLREYLEHGLVECSNKILQDQQVFRICGGDDLLVKDLGQFIDEVLSRSPSECSRAEVDRVFESPEFEKYKDYSPKWRTTMFKKFCGAKNISVNANKKGGRYQKVVNNNNEKMDYYILYQNEKKTDEPPKVGLQAFLVEAT